MNNHNTRTMLKVIAVVLAVMLAVMLAVLAWLLLNRQEPASPTLPQGTPATTAPVTPAETESDNTMSTDTTVETTVPATTEAIEDLKIDTPYVTLRYPGDWGGLLEVRTEDNTYVFVARVTEEKQQDLFSLTFGGSTKDALGIIRDEAGNAVPVHVQSFKFEPDDSWSDRERSVVFTMMDHLNYVLSNLPLEAVPEETVPPTTEPATSTQEAIGIDNAYCELMYPAKWADSMTLDVQQDSVAFYCVNGTGEKILLFTVYFGGEMGTEVKTITDYQGNSVQVRLEISELNFGSSWTEADRSTAWAMQEDLNFLLNNLP